MGEIISGQVSFSKTVKTGDYENEKADCRLDFNVAEGETCDSILALASTTAKNKVFEMLGKLKGSTVLPAQLKTAAEMDKPYVAAISGTTKADLAAAAASAAGAPASGTDVTKPKTTRVPKAAKETPAPEPAAAPAPASAVSEDDGMADLLGAEAPPVTDADLIAKVTATNARVKNAMLIRELTGKYVAPPKGVKDIPQELRSKYCAELDALKPAG